MSALSDNISRTVLALVNSGAADSIEDAVRQLSSENINIIAGAEACRTAAGQAAVMTAATTATRAVGRVHVDLADPGQPVLRGPYRRQSLGAAVEALGACLQQPGEGPLLLIGAETRAVDTEPGSGDRPVLTITWNGWTAAVRTGHARLAETGNQILAPIAAAALAVHEAFAHHRGRADGARRNLTLSLWDPTSDGHDPSPVLSWLPPAWHLVGLGHLGQAYAWTISQLPYTFADPLDTSNPLVTVQDVDVINAANHSTGVLLAAHDVGQLKTRVTAARMEAAGFTTRIVEQRLTRFTRRDPLSPKLALIGVDNPDTRQLISTVGWDLAIDVGLGGGLASYTGISLHALTADRRSDRVAGWRSRPATQSGTSDRLLSAPAYQRAAEAGHDICGLVQLAGRSVAASFVGIVAACLASAEPLRLLAGGPLTAASAYDLRDLRGLRTSTAGATDTPALEGIPADLSS